MSGDWWLLGIDVTDKLTAGSSWEGELDVSPNWPLDHAGRIGFALLLARHSDVAASDLLGNKTSLFITPDDDSPWVGVIFVGIVFVHYKNPRN